MKVTIYGSGYVGLVSGSCLAELGHDVLCIDIDEQKIQQLNQADVSIYEPGLTELVKRHVAQGTLRFSSDARQGVEHGLFQFIAVNTPPQADGSADISRVLAVADVIVEFANDDKIIVNKSTVPVGTAALVKQRVSDKCFVASNPEFLREGCAVKDFMQADRIVIGTDSDYAEQMLRELYQPLIAQQVPLITMSLQSSELTKYVANAMLASRISFMNEMANIAEAVGANIEEVEQGISLDPRIGPLFLSAGCGYGGSCFPKDVTALQQIALANDVQAQMLTAIDETNKRQRHILSKKLLQHFDGDLQGRTIAVWGLAFKPNTNDLREASSGYLLAALWQAGANVKAYDPVAMPDAQQLHGPRDDLHFCDSKEACLTDADALVVVTEWDEFKTADILELVRDTGTQVIVDGRNIYPLALFADTDISYYRIGATQ